MGHVEEQNNHTFGENGYCLKNEAMGFHLRAMKWQCVSLALI